MFLLSLLALVLVFGVVFVVGLLIYARWHYGQLEKLGIPVVKPHFCLGSNPNGHNEKLHVLDLERSKIYGTVYGLYDGRMPAVVVSDPDILRLIMSRDFDHFRNHRPFVMADTFTSELLDLLTDDKWKKVRSALTPHFSSGKIKQMSETICKVAEDYVAALLQQNQGQASIEINFKKWAPPLVLEIIGKCFCGIDIDNLSDPNNHFFKVLKEAMGGDDRLFAFDRSYTTRSAFLILAKLFPPKPNVAFKAFESIIRNIVKTRAESKVQKNDIIDTLVQMFGKSREDPEYIRLGITERTGILLAFEIFIASFESVRTTLDLFMFHIATNPEVQVRVIQEVDAALEKTNGRINPETIAELPFLTACITETLRLTPSFFKPDRLCNKDWEHNGLKIKKGMAVLIPLWALHRDPQQFPDPEAFDPERFMGGRKEAIHPYAFNAFGMGPRACPGRRLAYEMLKIILVNIFKEFNIERRVETVFRDKPGNPMHILYQPILVNFVPRNVSYSCAIELHGK